MTFAAAQYAMAIVLVPALVAASVFDIRERRVPNWLVVTLLVTGMTTAFFVGGVLSTLNAACFAALGLAMWLPFYALRMLGAGDVKLFAASSAWFVSLSQVLVAAAASAFIGGLLAIVWALFQGRIVSSLGNTITMARFRIRIPFERKQQKLPYGVAMAIGILWSFTRL